MPPSMATKRSQHTPLSAAPVVEDLSGVKKKMPWLNKTSFRAEKETPDSARSHSPSLDAYSKGSDSPNISAPDKPAKTQSTHSPAPFSGSSTRRSAQQSDASGSAFFVPPSSSPTTETDPKPTESKPAKSQPVDHEVLGFFFDPPIQPSNQSQHPEPPLQAAVKETTFNGGSNSQTSTPMPAPGRKRFNWARDQSPEPVTPAPAEEESSTVSGTPSSTASTARSRSSQHKHKKQKAYKSDSGRRASALPQWAKHEVRSSQGSPARRQRGSSIRSNRSGRSTIGPDTQP